MIPATGIRIVRIFGITCVDDADAQTRAGIQVFGRRIGKALPQTPVIRESATGGRSNWDESRHPAVIRSERLLGNGKKDEKGLLGPRKGTAEHNHL